MNSRTANTPPRAAIYVRVSTDEQAREGVSLDHQEDRCRAWAVGKGTEVVRVYRDEGFSAKDTRRPGYQAMLKDLQAGQFGLLVALKIDRLSRSAKDFYDFLDLADRHGVDFVAATQDVDTSTPGGRLLRGVLMTFAQFERELIAERVKENMRAKAARGQYCGGRIARTPGIESALTTDEIRQALQNVDALWAELFPAEQTRIVQLLVAGVVVEEKQVVLTLRTNGLRSLVLEAKGVEGAAGAEAGDQDTVTITIPAQFKRRGGRKEIIAPTDGGPVGEPVAPPQEPLVLALAQAHHWQELLNEGKFENAEALAERLHVSKEYVMRALRLNYLAPDIVQAILDGREPSGLSLVKLTQPLPADWAEQRAQLGFTG